MAAVPAEGLEIVGQDDCIIVQWDANSNDIWDREPKKKSLTRLDFV